MVRWSRPRRVQSEGEGRDLEAATVGLVGSVAGHHEQHVNRAAIKMSPADRREFADRTRHAQRDRGPSRER